jgi:hypothetical protein
MRRYTYSGSITALQQWQTRLKQIFIDVSWFGWTLIFRAIVRDSTMGFEEGI